MKRNHRPSPFGPVKLLLPENHRVVSIPASTTVTMAVREMIDAGYSQLPVLDESGKIIGMFSYRSLGFRVFELKGGKLIADLPVAECLEPAKFLDPEDFIDTTSSADFRDDDCVLVGSPENVIGVLSISDVFIRLNDFAEAFVLLHETEVRLRRLIEEVLTPEGVLAALEVINTKRREKGSSQRPLAKLADCEFGNYSALIASKESWQNFQSVFPTANRELLDAELNLVRDIRNDVMHFRRQITRADTQVLKRFRDRVNRASVTNVDGGDQATV